MQVKSDIPVLEHQHQFAIDRNKNSAIVGGFGSGKSMADVHRVLDRLKWREWAVVPVVAPTYQLLNDVNIPDFVNFFDDYNIPYAFNKSERKMIIKHGSLTGEVWFRSADKPERFVGFDATDIIIDEYDILRPDQQRDLYIKCLSRLRGAKDATLGISTTPEGFKETYELFHKKKIGSLIRAKTTDNPFLPEDYIDSLYAQYDEMLVKQYINAEFVNINGMQAYYAYGRDKNHKRIDITNEDEIGIGMDFNVEKMCAELFIHDSARKKLHFFDEIILKNTADTEKMCQVIKEKYPGKRYNVYPDATGKKRTTNATQSDIAILKKNGFVVYARSANPFVRDRLQAANVKLEKAEVTVDVDRCPDLVEDFEKVTRDKHGEIDKSDSKLTHSSDAATYPIAYLYPVKTRGYIQR